MSSGDEKRSGEGERVEKKRKVVKRVLAPLEEKQTIEVKHFFDSCKVNICSAFMCFAIDFLVNHKS